MPLPRPYPKRSLYAQMHAHPGGVFTVGIGLLLIMLTIGWVVGALLTELFYGPALNLGLDANSSPETLASYRFFQGVMQVLGFGLPAVVLSLGSGNWRQEVGLRPINWDLAGWGLLATIFLLPALQNLAMTPEGFQLPESWKGFEAWAESVEAQTHELTLVLLRDALLANILIVAVFAAVVEELLFRGWMQRTLARFLPAGWAIVIQALVFSIIHMQFLGFFVRWALGIWLGLLRHWTGSLWASMLVHFVNNLLAVLLVWAALNGYISDFWTDPTTYVPWAVALPAGVVGLGLTWALYRRRQPEAVTSDSPADPTDQPPALPLAEPPHSAAHHTDH